MPLLQSITPKLLQPIETGDYVSFRLVDGSHFSGILFFISPDRSCFSFVNRGPYVQAIEIHSIVTHERMV
ncbi:hypothetical protein [Paenibacillus lutrae]|uniref:Uncharacterized protein n=1 Tax=Paenibacillus lutrae TaxID=2078573 RepID=A0A7X3FLU8_9BACL|nr:hypothetical protein [Paenibacillus lutrae]MVP02096.1 hypothetical protein [Paenibacillus lutrae]